VENKENHTIRRGRLLYEGKSKRVYETDDPDSVLLEFKTEFASRQQGAREHHMRKPECATLIAEHIFQYLQSFRIPNHFVERRSTNELLVRRMTMIPVAIAVRNIAAGSLCERYNLLEGRELEFPIVELFYRNHQLDNPLVNESHILAFGASTPEEMRTMIRIATKTNAVLRSFLERRHFRLVDIWLEFGRIGSEIFIGDAIIPDTMRILDFETNFMFDGAVFRLGIGDYSDVYLQLCKRLTS
jgi:phosphoribosylaminoimidazole-succinocarboxamide synthase